MFSPHEFNQNGTFGNCLFLQIFRRFSDSFTSRVQIFLAAVASRIPIRSFFTPRVKSASIASVYFWDKVESIPFSLGFLHPGFSFPTLKNLLLPYRPLSTRAHIYIHLLYTTHVLNRVSILLSASWFNYFSFFATFVCVCFFVPFFLSFPSFFVSLAFSPKVFDRSVLFLFYDRVRYEVGISIEAAHDKVGVVTSEIESIKALLLRLCTSEGNERWSRRESDKYINWD